MKTTKFIYSSLAAFALMAASCSNDDAVTPDVTATPSSSEVSFLAQVTSRATDIAFEETDKISVYAWDGSTLVTSSYATYECGSDDTFTATTPITYATDDQKLSFLAIYPVTSGADFEMFDFAIVTNQSEGYTTSDLMVATVEETNTSKPVLEFSHLLSKVVVSVKSTDESVVLSSEDILVTVSSMDKVSVDASGESVAVAPSTTPITVTTTAPEKEINLLGQETGAYLSSAIVSPQASLTIILKVGETTYGDITFSPEGGLVSGVEYTLDLTLRDGDIESSGTIRNWTTGEDLGDIVIF